MHLKRNNILSFFLILFLMAALGFMPGCKSEVKEEKEVVEFEKLPDIEERLAKYSPTELTYDENLLNEEQKQVLQKLVLAARHMDNIFWKQASHKGLAIKETLKKSSDPQDKGYLDFLILNFGPYDRQEDNKPFIGSSPKPLGAGFYPADMTKEEFEKHLTLYPGLKEDFENTYTVIKREDGGLVAVPYNEEYRDELESTARYLREAAEITSNPLLKKYLLQRAEGLLKNDYYQSDCLWIDLKENLVEIVIGPFEVYEDKLMGLKAGYEAFVYINDTEEMEKIQGYIDYLDEMQKNLPVEQKYKDQEIGGLKSPLNVVFEVFTAGETKAGVQTSAFVLPNDERVREEKGTKKVFLKNMMEAKFNKSLIPISKRVLTADEAENVSFFGYFTVVMLHELSHVLGVNYVTLPDGTKITVKKALKERHSPIEEALATIVGLYSVRLLVDKGWIPPEKEKEIYTSYLAGNFRSLRFGYKAAHGLATLMEFNFLREKGAYLYDDQAGRFKLDMNKMRDSIKEMAQKLLILQGDGDYDGAGEFIAQYGKPDEITLKTIEKLTDIPVDIRPIFKFSF